MSIQNLSPCFGFGLGEPSWNLLVLQELLLGVATLFCLRRFT